MASETEKPPTPQQQPNKKDPTEEEEEEQEEEEEWLVQRNNHKAAGDAAFRVRAYRTAIDEYTKAISFDPDGYVVLYSNRSAAYLANSEISKSLVDARKCVELDPSFVKGHSRLAAALFALKRYDQSKDAYEHVLSLDKTNVSAQKGIDSCNKEMERRRMEQQQTLEEEERQRLQQQKQAADDQKVPASAPSTDGDDTGKGNNNDDDGQNDDGNNGDEDDEEDDLLNDFFDEVEEVVNKKKEAAAVAQQEEDTSSSTAKPNAIRNDRRTLGTTQEQVDRLLQPHYEWRNLNPYYVLQLPADTSSDDDISRRYKALSLLLHPDKNHGMDGSLSEEDRNKIQLAYDQVQKAKTVLADEDRKRYTISLIAEGMKHGKALWSKQQHQQHNRKDNSTSSLESIQEREVMRLFAQVEQKRREVEERERKYEQREQQKEDDELEKERNARKFDKSWRQEERVDKRIGNWRDFNNHNKKGGGDGSSSSNDKKRRKL